MPLPTTFLGPNGDRDSSLNRNGFLATRRATPIDDWELACERDDQEGHETSSWGRGGQREQPTRLDPSDENVRLWQQANTVRTTTSSPSYTILPSNSSSARSSSVPPSAALDTQTTNGPPKLMILKRPTQASTTAARSSSSSSPSSTATRGEKSLKEREREYAEARRRIYGRESQTSQSHSPSSAGVGGVETNDVTTNHGTSRDQMTRGVSPRVPGNNSAQSTRTPSPRHSTRPSPTTSRASTPNSSTGNLHGSLSRRTDAGSATSVIRKPKGPNGESRGFGGVGGGRSTT